RCTRLISIGARRATAIASSRARGPPTCRCRRRSSSSWPSTSRPRERSASKGRRQYSPRPTRRPNKEPPRVAAAPQPRRAAARAQQRERVPRVGVLVGTYGQTDREGQDRIAVFLDTFRKLGWSEGRNVRIDSVHCQNALELLTDLH